MNQVRYERSPSGLVHGAKPGPVIAMEVFGEKVQAFGIDFTESIAKSRSRHNAP